MYGLATIKDVKTEEVRQPALKPLSMKQYLWHADEVM